MHDPQDPEDAAVTSDPFGYTKVNGGEQNFYANKHEMVVMVVSLSMATLYNSHVVRVCFLKFQWFTGFYRYVVNFREVAYALCSIANLCI